MYEDRSSQPFKAVPWLLYGLAVLVLGLSVLGGLSIANATSLIPAATIGFQSPLLKPLWDGLVAGMQLAGVLVGTIGVALGLLIGGCGLLWSRSVRLGVRVQRLEAALAQAARQSPSPDATADVAAPAAGLAAVGIDLAGD